MTLVIQRDSPYERLYASRPGPLWNVPGRLVRRIAEWLPSGTTIRDAGCGDGKNALFLVQSGYDVSGIDISSTAIGRLHKRFACAGEDSSSFAVGDVCTQPPPDERVDCLVSYGLYHCLGPKERVEQHRRLHEVVRPGGYFLFCTLTDALPLPKTHRTPGITLASRDELNDLFGTENVVEVSTGTIRENHLPLVGDHEHAVTWIVAQRSS